VTSEVKPEDRERATPIFAQFNCACPEHYDRLVAELAAHRIAAERAVLERVERQLRDICVRYAPHQDSTAYWFAVETVKAIADDLARKIRHCLNKTTHR